MEIADDKSPAKPKILIIEDDWGLAYVLALRFKAAGFTVELAPDGETGLNKVQVFQPDLVLTDLVMPRLDGWEVCRLLHKNPATKNIAVMVMTGVRELGFERPLPSVGINRILPKPIDPDAVVKFVKMSAG